MNLHKMRYIVYKCNSSACASIANETSKCHWFLKVLTCQESNQSHIYQSKHHLSCVHSPKMDISLGMSRFIKDKAANGEMPARVMNDMVKTFKIQKADPKVLLPRVQVRVRNFRKNVLNDNDFVEDMEKLVQQNMYHPNLGDNVAFAFGYAVDGDGDPQLGKGTEENPLVVGFGTKTTIRRLQHAAYYMTHLDATFKLNTKGFPVIAIGISDMWRQFHLISMFNLEAAIQGTLNMYLLITGDVTFISYVMMDADSAQRNAFDSIALQYFTVDHAPKFMMCFFHVMKNVRKHTASLSKAKQQSVYRHVYSIHYARDSVEIQSRIQTAIREWKADSELDQFCGYFVKQWITSPYKHWQCAESPMGMAKTNNPIENFNGKFKQQHTQRRLLRLNSKNLQQIRILNPRHNRASDGLFIQIFNSAVAERGSNWALAYIL
ncbi:hypothetical protein PHMEG_00020671 [Phytophthora megakarya]|uniref:MULE transposase domain-containing protein n=1 Tax=Phytophthora megakarya TaxID=4795 RepID=A0A225VPF9_9STRA|nr:hypothetical protein PHMEG_00020671 [Phytophthora megakarya]